MFISIEAAIRSRLDPESLLPMVQLNSRHGEDDAGITSYSALYNSQRIGSVMLRRAKPRVGRGITKVEELRIISKRSDMILLRTSAELAILAMCSVEDRTLVSANTVTFEESAMWYRLEAEGVATIAEPFMRKTEMMHGEAVWDGRAFAPPIFVPPTSIG